MNSLQSTENLLQRLLRHLLHKARFIVDVLHVSEHKVFRVLARAIGHILSNQYVADLIRFVLLGSIVETGRQMTTKLADWGQNRE